MFNWVYFFTAAICVLSAIPLRVFASDNSHTIVVSATRRPTYKQRLAENVVVYTAEDIQRLPARDLSDVLAYMPGVDVQLNGQFGQASALSINGSVGRQVLLMVDGIPFNQQLSGQANPAMIPIEQIERIELIKGGASSAWGSSLGGVVNVITKDVGHTGIPKGQVKTTLAEFNSIRSSMSLSGAMADVGYFISGSYFNTDGTMDVTDVEEKHGFAKLALPITDGIQLKGAFGYNGADVFYGITPNNLITFQPYTTRYGQVSIDAENELGTLTAAYKLNDQKITTDILSGTSRALLFSTISANFYQGLSVQGSVEPRMSDRWVVGADLDWHRLKSNRYLDGSKSINMQGIYTNYSFNWQQLNVTPGLRYDHNQHFGDQVSPSLGAIYSFQDERDTLVRAKVSRAFNAPPLLWIYNDDPAFFVGANPDLKAERAVTYELGFESSVTDALDVVFNVYRADLKQGIALVFDTANFVFVQRNLSQLRRQGVEVQVTYDFNEAIELYATGAFNDVEDRVTGMTVRNQGVARQRYTLGMRYQTEKWKVNLLGYYNRWSSSAALQPNDRKPIFDLKLVRSFREVTDDLDVDVYLAIHNLTNSKYWSSVTFPQPKRYFEGGAAVYF